MSLTVLNETIHEKEVLHSQFIASLRHIETEDDFVRQLREIRELYPKAKHYCYGARLGNIEKMGDDGEPGHSAGLQILSALRNKKLENVSIIVVRYFGGVKLGLPRLTRTYREMAEEVIEKAKLVEAKKGLKADISLNYSVLESIKYQLDKAGFKISNIVYDEEVIISFEGEKEKVENYLANLDPKNILSLEENTLYLEVNI